MSYTKSFAINFEPLADSQAIVTDDNVRFTVLTSQLLRLEFSPTGKFEDRPSQAFWYRKQPIPTFTTRKENNLLEIETDYLHLNYQLDPAGFNSETLSIALKNEAVTWQYGEDDLNNLLGTARTLDNIDGALALEHGLMSRSGWAVYDDSSRLVFADDGWLQPRNAPNGAIDLYFFAYGQDYAACLQAFAQIAGPAPMIPRWALGNWWSRYWAYSDTELLGLMDEFADHNIPLSVCIVDMDWHITETGNKSSGWTGYTWNRELFPDPPTFIAKLQQRGLKTALNLHPAEGVHPHEQQYAAMANHLGIDPESQEPINFDIANTDFTKAYFELLHHPQEADGIDFWWTDWQQGSLSSLPGLGPLWWLNHLHFHDLGRNGDKRPFIFSRWGGLGNHRYPIGFSGDTHVTWESLQFQPYFTATAANVNYGWWSHDIGGHMSGIEDGELYARWLQFGVFSPILRLHCTNNRFHERRPWGWDAETAGVASRAMCLRHAFIPYIYTMSWRNHTKHLPLVTPMYYNHPADEQAYHCPDQYMFGSELLAAPFINPADPDTQLSKRVVWLPPGDWYAFFGSHVYEGDGWHAVYGRLEDIPIFAKAGAIVPLASDISSNNVDNPEALDIHLFPGADNQFELYEDDGLSTFSLTPITQHWNEQEWQVQINPVKGVTTRLPTQRHFTLLFHGIRRETAVSIFIDDQPTNVNMIYENVSRVLRVTAVDISLKDHLTVTLSPYPGDYSTTGDTRLHHCRKLVTAFRLESWEKQRLYEMLPQIVKEPALLAEFELTLTTNQLRALLEVTMGAGCHRGKLRNQKGEAVLLWNNQNSAETRYQLAAADVYGFTQTHRGQLPKFAFITAATNNLMLPDDFPFAKWRLKLNYSDILTLETVRKS